MSKIIKIAFPILFVIVAIWSIYNIGAYGFTDFHQCSELGGIMTAQHECSTLFGKTRFE